MIISLTFSLHTFSSPNFSQNSEYYCKDAYENKLARIDKNRTSREISLGASQLGFIALGYTLGYSFFSSTVGVVWAAAGAAPISATFKNIFDREERIREAYTFLNLAHTPLSTIEDKLYNEYIQKKYDEVNSESPEELVTIEKLKSTYPVDAFEYRTMVNDALDDVNKKRQRRELTQLSYSDFQQRLMEISDTDRFCNSIKLSSYNKIVRILKRDIGKVE